MDFIPQQGPATKPGQATPVLHPGAGVGLPDRSCPKPTDVETKQVTSLNPSCPGTHEHTALKNGGHFLFLPQEIGLRKHCSHPISSLQPDHSTQLKPLKKIGSFFNSKILVSPGYCSSKHMSDRCLQHHPHTNRTTHIH